MNCTPTPIRVIPTGKEVEIIPMAFFIFFILVLTAWFVAQSMRAKRKAWLSQQSLVGNWKCYRKQGLISLDLGGRPHEGQFKLVWRSANRVEIHESGAWNWDTVSLNLTVEQSTLKPMETPSPLIRNYRLKFNDKNNIELIGPGLDETAATADTASSSSTDSLQEAAKETPELSFCFERYSNVIDIQSIHKHRH